MIWQNCWSSSTNARQISTLFCNYGHAYTVVAYVNNNSKCKVNNSWPICKQQMLNCQQEIGIFHSFLKTRIPYFVYCMMSSNSQYEIEGIWYWQHYTQTHPLWKRMPNRRTPFQKAGSVKFMTVFMAYTWEGNVPIQKCIFLGSIFCMLWNILLMTSKWNVRYYKT